MVNRYRRPQVVLMVKTVREAIVGEEALFHGSIRARTEGESLVSPITKRACLAYELGEGSTTKVRSVDLMFTDASGPWPIMAEEFALQGRLLLIYARSYSGPKGQESVLYPGDRVSLVAVPMEVKSREESPRSYRSGIRTQIALGPLSEGTLNITRRGPG